MKMVVRAASAWFFNAEPTSSFQASSAVKDRIGAISLSSVCVMSSSAVCAERRARLPGAEVYRRSFRMSR
ncbi:hypothetical protein D3C72_1817010 [compost metagenome]